MTKKLEWEEARCPVCGIMYSYIKGGYKPLTCNNFGCVRKFHHSKIYDLRTRKQLDDLKSMRDAQRR